MTIGGTRVRVLAPSPDYVAGKAPSNDDSLVLEVTYKKRSILLTGDAERPVEDDMLADGDSIRSLCSRLGHHGSKTSSSEEFLEPSEIHSSPSYQTATRTNSIIPTPKYWNVLRNITSAVFRTDQRGLITFRTDGDKVEMESLPLRGRRLLDAPVRSKHRMKTEEIWNARIVAMLLWFISGVALGAAVALLVAPEAGQRTRRKLAEASRARPQDSAGIRS